MSIIYSKENDGTLNVMCAGKVVRDPELKEGNRGNFVKFSVNYGKSKFMDCEAWADSDVGSVAGCLEKGDTIAVMGTHRTWKSNSGREYKTLTADMIFTFALPAQPVEAPQSAPPPEAKNSFTPLAANDDELPF
jgi:single-stranded DNA-binding protein